MTMRALSTVPGRFVAGVALYGFVHTRWMTYEGGDFTWEDEYITPSPLDEEVVYHLTEEDVSEPPTLPTINGEGSVSGKVPPILRVPSAGSCSDKGPLSPSLQASDCFNDLHRITAPLLLMHGERDEICPLSQSQVAFHTVEKKGVPTGLLVYPEEGHGFEQSHHQQDRDRRILLWWREHLSPVSEPVPDFRATHWVLRASADRP